MAETRVRLRAITEADLPDYVRWFNDPEVTEFTAGESGNCTLEGEQEWFRKISDPEHSDRHWAIEVDGKHIGNCALMLGRHQETGAFGIVIGDKSAWGKGYGTAALREVLRIGFTELNLHRIHLDAFADNLRGLRCYEKCGFRREGLHRQSRWKRGEWRDIVSMGIVREEWEEERETAADDADGVTVRSYRPSDHDGALALWSEVGLGPDPCDSAEAISYKSVNDRGPFFVAVAEGRVVGSAMASWDGRWAWIYRMAVLPSWQRKGIGARLLARTEERLVELGAPRATLVTTRENERAISFYSRLGYEVRPRLVIMRKLLGAEEQAAAQEHGLFSEAPAPREEDVDWQHCLEALRPQPGETIVDAGCGDGTRTRRLAARVAPAGRVIGVERGPELVERAAARVAAEGLQEVVSVHCGDIRSLPLADGSADAWFCRETLEYLDDPQRALAEAVRVVRPGGRVVAMEADWDTLAYNATDKAAERRFVAVHTDHGGGGSVDGRTGRKLLSLFREAGLAEVRLEAYVMWGDRYAPEDCYVCWPLREGHARRGCITQEELDAWYADMAAQAERGRYFHCFSYFICTGRVR